MGKCAGLDGFQGSMMKCRVDRTLAGQGVTFRKGAPTANLIDKIDT